GAQESEQVLNTGTNGLYAGGYLFWQRDDLLLGQRFDPDSLKLSGNPRPIVDSVGRIAAPGKLIAAAFGKSTLVYGSTRAAGRLKWLDRRRKVLRPVSEEVSDRGSLRLSPDGRRVLVSRASSNGLDLWMLELEREVWRRFTFLPGVSAFPVWSPDGGAVV